MPRFFEYYEKSKLLKGLSKKEQIAFKRFKMDIDMMNVTSSEYANYVKTWVLSLPNTKEASLMTFFKYK